MVVASEYDERFAVVVAVGVVEVVVNGVQGSGVVMVGVLDLVGMNILKHSSTYFDYYSDNEPVVELVVGVVVVQYVLVVMVYYAVVVVALVAVVAAVVHVTQYFHYWRVTQVYHH